MDYSATLVILAGGKATRIGKIGNYVSKVLLPLFDTNLLYRQIKHAQKAGIKNIVVSTNSDLYAQIKDCLVSDLISASSDIRVINNKEHAKGSLPALLNIIVNEVETSRVVMSLGDIFFIANPFLGLKSILCSDKIFLLSSIPFDARELGRGGILLAEGDQVHQVIEKAARKNKKGIKWNGLAVFNSALKDDLALFLKTRKQRDIPEGDFFEFLIRNGHKIFTKTTCDFVNNNNSQSIMLSSLYEASEYYSRRDNRFKKDVDELILKLRKKLV